MLKSFTCLAATAVLFCFSSCASTDPLTSQRIAESRAINDHIARSDVFDPHAREIWSRFSPSNYVVPGKASGKLKRPEPLSQPPPIYPPSLKAAYKQALVYVGFLIDKDGSVKQVETFTEADPEFAECTKRAVATWKFTPPTINGAPVTILVQEEIGFTLY